MSTLAPSTLLLMSGANQGDLNKVKEALTQGADVNARDMGSRTALMRAAGNGYVEIVRFLLTSDANVNASDPNGRTALMEAAQGGRLEILQLLLAKGADVNAVNSEKRTALSYAVGVGLAENVELLFEAGGSADFQKISWTEKGRAAFMNGIDGGPPIKTIVQRWLQKKAREAPVNSSQSIDLNGILSKATSDAHALTEVQKEFNKLRRPSIDQRGVLIVLEFMELMIFDGLDQCLESYDLLSVLKTFKKIGARNAEKILEESLRAAHDGALPKNGSNLHLLDAAHRKALNFEVPLGACDFEIKECLIAFIKQNKDALSKI